MKIPQTGRHGVAAIYVNVLAACPHQGLVKEEKGAGMLGGL